MRELFFVFLFVLAACAPSQPTSVTPTEVLDQHPTPLPTPTLASVTKPIAEEEQEEAFNFFYELKNNMALGEYEHIAEEVRYPITAHVDGEPKTFVYVAEFEANFEKIFNEAVIQRFISTDESELTFTEQGVKVADGIVWFDLICMDPNCDNAEFLITEINN
jgi:hypothetical protein